MSSTIDILKNANRLILDQLDAAEERIKARETEARQALDNCLSKRESIKRKRQLIQDIERVQLESIAEIEEVEALAGDLPERPMHLPERSVHLPERTTHLQERPGQDVSAPARIADRLAFAVVKASQSNLQLKR